MSDPERAEDQSGKWQRRKHDRPAEILAAARDAFVSRGFRSTRLEDIAKRAGVTKGTIYLYYRNKEALFVQVVRDTIGPFLADAEQTAAGFEGAASELLVILLDEYWRRLGEADMAAITRLMQIEGAHFPELAAFYATEVLGRGRRLVATILQHGVERGEFRPVDAAAFAEVLFAIVEMASTQRFTFRQHDPDSVEPGVLVRAGLDFLIRGLSAGGSMA